MSQWQVEACVEGISEAFLLPVLELVIAQFPFEIAGFHSDNGSEYVNHKVTKMLEKLRIPIEQTKSRSRHSNHNALAESKNASVVRKHMGYSHIPQKYAKSINAFYEGVFNSWLNLHRPCLFASEIVSDKGKIIKRYKHRDVKTPLECLVLLNKNRSVTFKAGTKLENLLVKAREETDLETPVTTSSAGRNPSSPAHSRPSRPVRHARAGSAAPLQHRGRRRMPATASQGIVFDTQSAAWDRRHASGDTADNTDGDRLPWLGHVGLHARLPQPFSVFSASVLWRAPRTIARRKYRPASCSSAKPMAPWNCTFSFVTCSAAAVARRMLAAAANRPRDVPNARAGSWTNARVAAT